MAIAKKNSFAPMTAGERQLAEQSSFDEAVAGALQEEEERFLREYREKRMRELMGATAPTYGNVRTISRANFIAAVEQEPADVNVVINLESNQSSDSKHATFCLREVARRYPHTKFCVADVHHLKPEWNMALLPSLLVYRGGELHKSLIAFGRELGSMYFAQDLADYLASEGIVAPSTGDWRSDAERLHERRSDSEEEDEEDGERRFRRSAFVY
eukprot:TRINITY_DN4649_c0_g1_i1.p1 TRINITY_DN4649_c0_g1~~TRINITY_DN4649_c0_g1_i1.p1  ORF type:complete len:214 (+),score=77.24 TRINITY_DN4649_c0_g1_i1:149-790(+)